VITLRVASQRMLIVVSVYFVIDSVRKLLDTPSYGFPPKTESRVPVVSTPAAYPGGLGLD
jgi:hypothetical protein